MSATARQGAVSSPPQIRIGDLALKVLDGGPLWLDGGAMFGIIPKPIWSRLVDVDDANRIPLATNCFYLDTAGKKIIIETGCGHPSKFDAKEQGFFKFSNYWLADSFAAAGIDRESIDFVILTHLHFDHAGGATMPDGNGGFIPTFPRARYIVQQGEWDDAVTGHAVMTGTYRRENLAPLETSGVLSFVNGEAEIVPGVRVRPFPGHTRHQQSVVFESGNRRAILPADLMPTSAHLGLRFNMAYDLMPFENMKNKERFLLESAEPNTTLLIGQDPHAAHWRLGNDEKGRQTLAPAESGGSP
ncbi:MAG TPA: MBL fold metallo-hydrolase [Phycisphaerae bacterium]|nr:MBL fold metallo-hydrolase [Phycisphaerae bacterium]